MEEDAAGGFDNVVTEFNTYEDFLDSQITPLDLYYLEVRMWFIVLTCNCTNVSATMRLSLNLRCVDNAV